MALMMNLFFLSLYFMYRIRLFSFFPSSILVLMVTITTLSVFVPSISAQQRMVDSLVKEYTARQKTPSDTAFVNLLNNLSFASRSVSAPKAEEYAKNALQQSRALGFRLGEGDALRNLAYFQNERGDTTQAIALLDTSYAIFEKLGDKSGMAKVLNNRAVIIIRGGNDVEALKIYYRSLALAQAARDARLQAITYVNVAAILNTQGANVRSIETYFQAFRLADSLHDESVAAIALSRIASMYLTLDDSAKAAQYYFQAYTMQEKIGNKAGMATTLNSLSGMMRDRGNFNAALEYGKRSLTLRLETNDARNLPLAQRSLARAYKALKMFPEAHEYFTLALQGLEKTKNTESYLITLNDITELYRSQDSLQQALTFAAKAIETVETNYKTRDLGILAETYLQTSKVYEAAGKYQQSLIFQQKASTFRDSLYRQGRKNDLKQMEERIRIEQFLREQQQKTEQERRRLVTLQYSGIVLLVLIMLMIAMLVGRRFALRPVLTRWVAFVAVLLAFESLQVLIDPWTQQYIGTTPLAMLAVNLILAIAFSPLANFAESYLLSRRQTSVRNE